MAKYKVLFKAVPIWVYEYEVEADSHEKAHDLAKKRYFNAERPDNNYLSDTRSNDIQVMEL